MRIFDKNSVPLERTKSGIPAMWEKGGGFTNTGEVTIIADESGNPKNAIFVRTRGDLACGHHALIPVEIGDIIVTVDRHRDKVAVTVDRIIFIDSERIQTKSCEDRICVDAISAAIEKSYDYHCRRPYYIRGL